MIITSSRERGWKRKGRKRKGGKGEKEEQIITREENPRKNGEREKTRFSEKNEGGEKEGEKET